MAKKESILSGDKARAALLEGVSILAETVGSTLGPKGKNVILDNTYGPPNITKDGVSVAKKVEVHNPAVNVGIRLLREAASQTNNKVGDGTTTSTVLAHAIYAEGLKSVAAGANPTDLKRGIDHATNIVKKELAAQAKQVKGNKQIEQIATISANGDKEIGQMIAKAFEAVGSNGVITVEEAQSTQNELKTVEGLQFDRPYISPLFINKPEKMTVELDSPYFLLVRKKMSVLKEALPILGEVHKTGKSLLIIAEDVEGEVLTALIMNKLQGGLKVAAVKAPGFGDNKNRMLEDIAILTGGRIVGDERGLELDQVTLGDLGRAGKVIITKKDTTIVNGHGDKKAIKSRIEQLGYEIKASTSDYDREKLQKRLASLAGGVAVIYAGAPTETEMKEKKDRVVDAVNATQAASERGIVPGGGVAFIRAMKALEDATRDKKLDVEDQIRGVNIVKKALTAPIKTIARNADLDGSIILEKIKAQSGDFGYNVATNQYCNLYDVGVIDPLKVVESALLNAASIAGVLLTTNCIVLEKQDKQKNAPMPGGGMGGGMM